MKLLTLDVEPSSKRGGQELSLVDECVALAGRGMRVTLAHVRDGDLLARYRAAGVETIALAGIDVQPSRRIASALAAVRSIARATATRPHVVCMNQYHDTLFGAAVARLAGAPLICHLRLMPPDETCTQWRVGLSQVARFMASSRAIATAWVERMGIDAERIDVGLDGIDVDFFAPRPTRDATRASLGVPRAAFVVLSVGRLDRSKNIEGLLRAFAALDVAGAVLLIVGRPVSHGSAAEAEAYVASLKALSQSLGVADSVQWLGSRSDVPDLLAAADVSTLFAHEEALGRVTMEALSCGRPIVASRGGGTDELLTGEFARLRIDPHDPAAAAAAMRNLVGWQSADAGFSERARDYAVRNFSIDAKARALEASFARTLAERGRGPVGAAGSTPTSVERSAQR